MNNVHSNTQFLFSTHKHDEEKRFSIILTLKSVEEAVSKSGAIHEILYKLNNHYKQQCSDIHPYHYILTSDGICHNIRDSILSAPTTECEFREYKDDIRILIMVDRLSELSKAQEKSLIDVLAKESKRYAILLSDTIYFQKSKDAYIDDVNKYKSIIKKAILKRNSEDSMFSILEHVIDEQVVINKKIRAIPPFINEFGLSDIAIKYNVPLSILENLNPHITESNSQDIVFIPNVKIIEYKHESLKIYKRISLTAYKIKKLLEVMSNGV